MFISFSFLGLHFHNFSVTSQIMCAILVSKHCALIADRRCCLRFAAFTKRPTYSYMLIELFVCEREACESNDRSAIWSSTSAAHKTCKLVQLLSANVENQLIQLFYSCSMPLILFGFFCCLAGLRLNIVARSKAITTSRLSDLTVVVIVLSL